MAKGKQQRDSVVFYRSFYEAVKELEPVQQAEVYNAVLEFGLNGTEPKLMGVAKAIFTLIKPQIIANNARYFNGQKGGRPKKDETESEPSNEPSDRKNEPKSNQKETKQKPKQNLDETESEPKDSQSETKAKPNVNENDNDILGLDSERDITRVRAREERNFSEVIHKHLYETLPINFFRKQLSSCDTFVERLPLFDEYVSILEQADTERKVEALLLLDEIKFAQLFDSLRKENIQDKYRYVWKSVFAYAKEKKA